MLEFLVGGDLRADVGMGPDEPRRPALGIALDYHAAVEYPEIVAVLVANAVAALVDRGAALDVVSHRGQAGIEVVGMDARLPFIEAVADLVVGVAEHGLPLVGEEDAGAADIPVPDALGGTLEGELPTLFRQRQRRQGAFRLVPPALGHRDQPGDQDGADAEQAGADRQPAVPDGQHLVAAARDDHRQAGIVDAVEHGVAVGAVDGRDVAGASRGLHRVHVAAEGAGTGIGDGLVLQRQAMEDVAVGVDQAGAAAFATGQHAAQQGVEVARVDGRGDNAGKPPAFVENGARNDDDAGAGDADEGAGNEVAVALDAVAGHGEIFTCRGVEVLDGMIGHGIDVAGRGGGEQHPDFGEGAHAFGHRLLEVDQLPGRGLGGQGKAILAHLLQQQVDQSQGGQ